MIDIKRGDMLVAKKTARYDHKSRVTKGDILLALGGIGMRNGIICVLAKGQVIRVWHGHVEIYNAEEG